MHLSCMSNQNLEERMQLKRSPRPPLRKAVADARVLHIVLRMQLLRLQPWQPRRTRSRRTTLGERRRPLPRQ